MPHAESRLKVTGARLMVSEALWIQCALSGRGNQVSERVAVGTVVIFGVDPLSGTRNPTSRGPESSKSTVLG